MSRLRLATLALLAAAALAPGSAAAAPSARAAAAPAAHAASCSTSARDHFFGLGGADSYLYPAFADCVLGQQASVGVGVLRQAFSWSDIEPAPNVWDWHYYDRWVAKTAAHHMKILAILTTPPAWAQKKVGRYMSPPRSNAQYAHFVAAVVRRYGAHGYFWTQNPLVPKVPIHDWQIWNEPNLPQYWSGHPNARQYTRLLKSAYKAVKHADRHADVVTAGLPESTIHGAIRVTKFLPQLYRAKAQRSFDTLAVNPYAPTARGVVALVKKVRKVMVRHRDRADHLWVTEVGWGTGGPKQRFNIGKRAQARQLKILVKDLWKLRRKLRLRGIVYFDWRDRPPYGPQFKDMWGLHTGLLDLSGRPKPALAALKRVSKILH